MKYAELNCLSQFSFQRGASSPEALVRRAHELGYQALAITDECSFAGSVRAHVEAKALGIKLLHGTELTLGPERVVLLCRNHHGYSALCALISDARRAAEKGSYQLAADALKQLPGDDVILLWRLPRAPHTFNAQFARQLANSFSHHYIALALHLVMGEQDYRHAVEAFADANHWPIVASHDVHMDKPSARPLQDVMTCLKHHTTLAQAGLLLYQNSERHLPALKQLYTRYPAAYLQRSIEIAALCNFSFDQLNYQYPHEVSAGVLPAQRLRQLTWQGAAQRWRSSVPPAVKSIIEHELKLIIELEYEHFFLTVHDIVRFAKGRGILCQGRGSAANSAVCFCLSITEVDPSRQSMLFERFISKERREPPDIDVDFEHERREEVIQYIYQRYGRHRAALTAAVTTYRPRSAIRDIAKVLGMDASMIDALARAHSWWDQGEVIDARLKELGFNRQDPLLKRLIWLLPQILGAPRQLSQHSGGFVISEAPLHTLVPIENAAMPERTIIQWDKNDLESLGLLKVDILALGMLSALRRSFALIKAWHHLELSPATVPAEDPATYQMLQNADAIGVFQVESRAQLSMLPRLKPACFYDLAIEVALVRPGPIQGGMVNPYLRRREGIEAIDYPSNPLKTVLERTLGVPVFQEQVMQIAMVAGGFDPGEADQLRRAMAAWDRSGDVEQFENKLLKGMTQRGYSEDFSQAILAQIKGFGAYGFPESHAISFALITYVSAYIKCHYPAEFCCALLNSQPMGFYSPDDLIQDLRRHGIEVLPVCVLRSQWEYSLERTGSALALRVGLCAVKGLAFDAVRYMLLHRQAYQNLSLSVFIETLQLPPPARHALNHANAFSCFSTDRHHSQWIMLGMSDLAIEEHDNGQLQMIPTASEADNLLADYTSLGFSLDSHPMKLLHKNRHNLRALSVEEWQDRVPDRGRATLVGLIKTRQRPGSAEGVLFMTLEDETGHANIVVWPQIFEANRQVILSAKLIAISGKMQRQGKVLHLIAERVTNCSEWLETLRYRNRAFR